MVLLISQAGRQGSTSGDRKETIRRPITDHGGAFLRALWNKGRAWLVEMEKGGRSSMGRAGIVNRQSRMIRSCVPLIPVLFAF